RHGLPYRHAQSESTQPARGAPPRTRVAPAHSSSTRTRFTTGDVGISLDALSTRRVTQVLFLEEAKRMKYAVKLVERRKASQTSDPSTFLPPLLHRALVKG